MSTAINLYVEVRGEDGKWSLAPGPAFRGVDYTLFAILAGTENTPVGYDPTASLHARPDRVVPIDLPRGLPNDVSAEVESEHVLGDYNHSWFTLRELLEVPWTERLVTERGWVTGGQYIDWLRWRRRPSAWMEQIHGGIHDVAGPTTLVLLDKNDPDKLNDYVIMVEWTRTWLEVLGELKDTIMRMGTLAVLDAHGMDGVRIVFWFDS